MPEATRSACRIRVAGRVQGVGFRPFVYRLALEHGLSGWVRNVTGAVHIHAEGEAAALTRFIADLRARAPAIAQPEAAEVQAVPDERHTGFSILDSEAGAPDIHVPPDLASCPECLAELSDPGDRRHGYPFINCTQCGPRYTLIDALPYDRANTRMAGFPLCAACRAEYEDPGNRRFHAEPVACPVCGPHLEYRRSGADSAVHGDEACITATLADLNAGAIVAVKGIGGYHLLCDAGNAATIARLRANKPRPAKPLAVLCADLEQARALVRIDATAAAQLSSPARPILILPRHADGAFQPADGIAPGLAELGVFLPYSPLHHRLAHGFGRPLVATSGNLGGEPVLTDNEDAEQRLAHVADAFLHHDRPIARPADDSVWRMSLGRPRPIRLGRGCAPLELSLPRPVPEPVLALGGHMKNCICLAWEQRAVLSPHIGELDNERSLTTFAEVAETLQRLYAVRARRLLVDRHPGYGYQSWARARGLPLTGIGHHRTHASALAWEHPGVEHWILFTWDGVGLGDDGTLWGGEAFTGRPGAWTRRASLRPFRLPGGEAAARQPWRAAAALLWETGQAAPFAPELLHQAWQRGINSPQSSAAGRLFDAAAALLGLCHEARFEGEGPMRLEALAAAHPGQCEVDALPLFRDPAGIWRADWAPLLAMLANPSLAPAERSWLLHARLAETVLAQALKLAAECGSRTVGLAGGVFQNRILVERIAERLAAHGFVLHLNQQLPVNDAGLGLGQTVEFAAGGGDPVSPPA